VLKAREKDRGKPTARWLEDAENDLQELKVNTWRRKANNKLPSTAKKTKFVEQRNKYVGLYIKF
jgi:hypothetical protein